MQIYRSLRSSVSISPIAQHVDISKCHFANIYGNTAAGFFGCVSVQDEDVFIDDIVDNGYSPSYVILKCIGNTFEKITCEFPFYEFFNNGNNKTYCVYGKDCYIIEDNVIIDEPDFDANKLYQIVFR